MTWCDASGHWASLLAQVAQDRGISLITVRERTVGDMGSPTLRREIQERIEKQESFVLHVEATASQLGWLAAQALRSEEIYQMSLREQLRAWGFRPQDGTMSDEQLAQHALLYFQQDLATWALELQPDILGLLRLLAEGTIDSFNPTFHDRLHLTIDAAGLPLLDEQKSARWRTDALARLLVTDAHRLAPDRIRGDHEYLIEPDKRAFALSVLDLWTNDASLAHGLAERILEADYIILLRDSLKDAPIASGPFISYAAERAVFAHVCAQLTEKDGRELFEALAAQIEPLQMHASSFWGDRRKCQHDKLIPWGELVRMTRAVKKIRAAMPYTTFANYKDMLNWYTSQGFQVEQAGDEILQYIRKPVIELLKLLMPLRQAYYHLREEYMQEWSDLWVQAGCPVASMDTQGMWLREQLKDPRPTAVLFLDALRYDLGVCLKDEINRRQGIERAQITAARSALPTLSALGMGTALPIDENDLVATLQNGHWHLYQKGCPINLSQALSRRIWLSKQDQLGAAAMLPLDAIEKSDLPVHPPKNARLFLFDDLIDQSGLDDNLEAIGTRNMSKRYGTIIEHLCDSGWQRVLIVTDSGFIRLPDEGELRVDFPTPSAPRPVKTSRRALAYPKDRLLAGPHTFAPGGDWLIAFPRGAGCFSGYGGLRFVHGGASLQEWIVPCIKVDCDQ